VLLPGTAAALQAGKLLIETSLTSDHKVDSKAILLALLCGGRWIAQHFRQVRCIGLPLRLQRQALSSNAYSLPKHTINNPSQVS
jgi:hypothetical protein